ncbi:MAG TPA: hypothetical protein VIL71_06065 [Spirillospora sp.]
MRGDMHGDMASLFDAHGDRVYAYCWSLVGDRFAAAATEDAFAAAVRRPPRGDTVLWLYSLARSVCAERGAFTGEPAGRPLFAGDDPLLRAAAALRADHREVLLLRTGQWLDTPDIARVVGLAPDTVAQLLAAARTRLERTVLDLLMRGGAGAPHELITAFEKNRLPRLLARRAPSRAPAGLRERVLDACEAVAEGRAAGEPGTRPLPGVLSPGTLSPGPASPAPLVVIGSGRARGRDASGDTGRARRAGGLQKGLGAAAGVAASAAAAAGLITTWPSAGGDGAASVVPSSSGDGTNPASRIGDPRHPTTDLSESELATGTGEPAGPAGAPSGPVYGAGTASSASGAPGGGTATAPPAGSPSPTGSAGTSSPSPSTRPSGPPATSPGSPSPSTPPTGTPTAPPDGGSGEPSPSTPPGTPSDPPTGDPGTPAPSPTSNPQPSPSG